VAKNLLDKDEDEDPYTIFASTIESNRGRVKKAVRFLKDAGVIASVSKKVDHEIFKILKFEESIELAVKPVFTKNWDTKLIVDVANDLQEYDELKLIGYKQLHDFTKSELLYLHWHLDEFDIQEKRNEKRSFNFYFLKEQVTFNNKAILKCLVELELLYNFPQYIQEHVRYDTSLVYPTDHEEFVFKKYAISSVFLKGELEAIFERYENHMKKANAMLDAFNKTKAWVTSIGGYKEAIKLIRKEIINDFREGKQKYINNLGSGKAVCIDSTAFLKLAREHLDLLNYETLYEDPELKGDEVFSLNINDRGYYSPYEKSLQPVELEEFENEPENEGDDLEEQAA
jgi:hypothetical protein